MFVEETRKGRTMQLSRTMNFAPGTINVPPHLFHGNSSISRQAIYDPSNFYLVHLDRKDNDSIREDLENFIKDWDNVRCVGSSLFVFQLRFTRYSAANT